MKKKTATATQHKTDERNNSDPSASTMPQQHRDEDESWRVSVNYLDRYFETTATQSTVISSHSTQATQAQEQLDLDDFLNQVTQIARDTFQSTKQKLTSDDGDDVATVDQHDSSVKTEENMDEEQNRNKECMHTLVILSQEIEKLKHGSKL